MEEQTRPDTERIFDFAIELRKILEENAHKDHWSGFGFSDCMAVVDDEGSELAEAVDDYQRLMSIPVGERGQFFDKIHGAVVRNLRKEVRDVAIAMFFVDEFLGRGGDGI